MEDKQIKYGHTLEAERARRELLCEGCRRERAQGIILSAAERAELHAKVIEERGEKNT